MSWFYVAMQREPVVMWSCFIGFTGENPPNPFPRPSRLTPFIDVARTEGFFSSLHPIQLWWLFVTGGRCSAGDCRRASS